MMDTRLAQASALLDDARTLLVDIVDSRPLLGTMMRDFNSIDAARLFINSALVHIQDAESDDE